MDWSMVLYSKIFCSKIWVDFEGIVNSILILVIVGVLSKYKRDCDVKRESLLIVLDFYCNLCVVSVRGVR